VATTSRSRTATKKSTARKTTVTKKVAAPRNRTRKDTGLSQDTLLAHNRRQDIEAELDSKGVRWRFLEEVKIDEIDLEKSLRNQARIKQKVDEEVVARYVEGMNRGDVFPPILFARGGRTASSKFVNIDGNHRVIAAKKAGNEVYPFGAYEIYDAQPEVIVMMTFEANTKHGLPTSEEERVHQAIWLIDNGATQAAAAQAVNVPKSAIAKLWNKVQADRRASDAGIPNSQWDHFNQFIKNRLVTVSTDEGLVAMADLAFKAKFTADEVNAHVNDLNGSRSGTKQKQQVSQWREAYADRIAANLGGVGTNVSKRGATPVQRYRMTLGAVLSLPEEPDNLAKMFAAGERAEQAQRAREAAKKFNALAKALDAVS
jgi:hypothetical protein